MLAFIARRLVQALVLLLVITFVVFIIFFGIPRLAGVTTDQLAAQYVGRDPSPDRILAVKQNLGFDRPIYAQYFRFLKQLLFGAHFKYGPDAAYCRAPCFGYSFKSHLAVWPDLSSRLPVTFSLVFGAAIIWLVSGVSIGIVSALRPGSILDRVSMGVALAGVSLPIFFTGLLAKYLFQYNWLHIWKDIRYVPLADNPLEWAWNLVLPWLTLAFLCAAIYARLARAGMLEAMSEDFVRTARAKGLTERAVILRHGLRAVLNPIVTVFGLDVGLVLGSTVLTETVFSLPGIGQYSVKAVEANDLPKILAVSMFAAFFVVVANLIVDILYAVIDPRVRYS